MHEDFLLKVPLTCFAGSRVGLWLCLGNAERVSRVNFG